jgi:hypothetical protein
MVFPPLALVSCDNIEVLLHASLCVRFVVSFQTFGWVMSYFLVFEIQHIAIVLCIIISIWGCGVEDTSVWVLEQVYNLA